MIRRPKLHITWNTMKNKDHNSHKSMKPIIPMILSITTKIVNPVINTKYSDYLTISDICSNTNSSKPHNLA